MITMMVIAALVSFIVSVILGRILIPVLKSIKMGQKILDIGPRWHKSKEGTPTMGGIFFIGGILAAVLTVGIYAAIRYDGGGKMIIHLVFMLFCALTGFIDDYTKFVKKQNKGLSPSQKLVLQFASAVAYVIALTISSPDTSLALPFTDTRLELGIFYYLLITVGIVFTVNSVNLTDGIDGLAASVTAVASIFFCVMFYKLGIGTAAVVFAAVFGGMIGFLVYNFHPAKVFMGDTGSLFLGGAVAAAALWLDMPLLLVFTGIIYYVEALSVMIQVFVYKLTKKRVFKMSPIHHHFELCGWNEVKIVMVFSAITLLFSAVGCYGFLIA